MAAPNFAALADHTTGGWGLPPLAGPFAFSAAAFVLASVVLLILLRPDPLLTARRLAAAEPVAAPAEAPAPRGPGMRGPGRWYASAPPPGSASPRWRSATWSWSR